ncbi:MAG: DUF1501 domain-containing protein [Pirellulales bacterium]
MRWSRTSAGQTSRRELLGAVANGFGALACSALLAKDAASADKTTNFVATSTALASPLAARPGHFAARVKRVIFLFMHGGPSQVDTFDYKPLLIRDHGKPLPLPKPRVQFAQTGNLLAPQWEFRQHGASGQWISSLFPQVARHADDLCIVNSMYSNNVVHGDAVLQLHTGSDVFTRPSMGSWITYGLGTENENLPGFVTISPSYAHGGSANWSSAFLPATHQGTPIGNDKSPIKDAAVRHIHNGTYSRDVQQAQLEFLRSTARGRTSLPNREDRAGEGASIDSELEARIASFELAFRMQTETPRVMDLSNESQETLALYGINDPTTDNFGRQCLLARRFSESGVRFVQCSHSYKWDQHSNLKAEHAKNALEVDRPIAALLADLKRRGLWDDTLVMWGSEFGRTPTAQGTDGRDHNPYGYSMWLAGGAVRGGLRYGSTDDYGYYAVENRVHVHDLHATLLHLLGLDHERLTFPHAGRDFRLADVHGRVVHEWLNT